MFRDPEFKKNSPQKLQNFQNQADSNIDAKADKKEKSFSFILHVGTTVVLLAVIAGISYKAAIKPVNYCDNGAGTGVNVDKCVQCPREAVCQLGKMVCISLVYK